jgi:ligand-binding sensor domain-containing protein
MAEARILYLATADGLVQLANPGKSDRWREVGRALEGQDVRAVATSPNDPLLAYAVSAKGVSRSTSGGQSWDLVQPEPSRAVIFDRAGEVYVGTERGVVLHSADGETWDTSELSDAAIVQLVLLPDDKLLSVAADGTFCKRTPDGWKPSEMHVPQLRGLTVSPSQQQQLFCVNAVSLATRYGAHGLPAKPTGALVVLSGQPEVLLIGTQEALLRSEDQGNTSQAVEGPTGVSALVTLPRFIDQAFAGTSQGALWFSPDRGRSWTELADGFPPIRGLAFARAL